MSLHASTGSPGLSLSPRTVRELIYRVLERHRQTGCWVQEELAAEFARGAWSPADRRLATEITCGVVRRQRTLSHLLKPATTRPWDRIEPELITLLWVGAYQLVYLDRVPAFAAIHETVEVARALGQLRWTGFANGILRSLDRVLREETQAGPAENAIPIRDGHYRLLDFPVFPNPDQNLGEYIAEAFSLPDWLVARWQSQFDRDALLNLAMAVNTPPGLFVRVNRRRATPESLQKTWAEAGIHSESTELPDALRVFDSGAVEELPGYDEGLFSPQDLTAMRAAQRLAPGPDERVWDMCAAPGTKACHLAELRDDHGNLLATDLASDRLSLIASGAERLGLTSIQVQAISSDLSDLPTGPFDAILLDAPCSNTGVLQRRPEARWRLTPHDPTELAQVQCRLLQAGLERLAPGGRLLYSTCSIEPEENSGVVEAVCGQHPGIEVHSMTSFLPGPQGDGGFQALLKRVEAAR